LTNDKASMRDSIYPRAKTVSPLTTIMTRSGVYVQQLRPPPMLRRGTPIKNHMLHLEIHEQVQRQLISAQASKAKGNISATRHWPRWGKVRSCRASIPPTRELQVRVGGKPAWQRRPPLRLRSEAKPAPPGSGLWNTLEYHPPHHQEVSRIGSNAIEASNRLSYIWTHW
jgi:hypothetical protein